MSDSTRLNVWSCGGGTQSAAIAALIVRGRLPKPDIALMVDTEREKSSTWEYVYGTIIPALASVGVELHIIKKSDYATVDLHSHKGTLLLPVFTNQSGEVGKFRTFCSGEWKTEVQRRWLRARGVNLCRTWIGISRDEMRRVRVSDVAWNQNCYPFLEAEFGLYYDRADCIREVTETAGWPKPPRSSCWMCPNMGPEEWLEMKANQPADFALATQLEADLHKSDANFFLHEQCVPLDQVDWELALQQGKGKNNDCMGMCFV